MNINSFVYWQQKNRVFGGIRGQELLTRESGNRDPRVYLWIPAFAGMTSRFGQLE